MKYLIGALLALSLGACATASTTGAMVPTLVAENIIEVDSVLYESVAVGEVTGGKETNPLWVSKVANDDFAGALSQTLSAHAMLAPETNKYRLDADLVGLKQPFAGLDMTVTSTVQYTLTDVDANEVVYSSEVKTPYTAKMGDAFVAVQRLKLANEGSIRANLSTMISEMVASMKGEVPAAAETGEAANPEDVVS